MGLLNATLAFGMGIDIHDIANVIHWGPTDIVLDYWQGVGPYGHDGRQRYACMYSTDGIVMFNYPTFRNNNGARGKYPFTVQLGEVCSLRSPDPESAM